MDSNYSQSGRLKRPTEKFQTYVQESSLRKKCKPVDISHKALPGNKTNKLKSYLCSHCGFSTKKKNSQDFIKSHHLMKDNKECFLKGLVHCPNSDCSKVFLTDIDMERHCSMTTSSKTNCLQAYRVSKTISNVYERHASSQVEFNNVNHMSSTEHPVLQLGTLYQDTTICHGTSSFNCGTYRPAADLSQQGNFTSASHEYNVLFAQGNYITTATTKSNLQTTSPSDLLSCNPEKSMLLPPTNSPSELEKNDEQIDDHEPDLDPDNIETFETNQRPVFDDEGNYDTASEHSIMDSNVAQDVLTALQNRIDTSTSTSCITKEEQACIKLEELLRNSGSPLYLYDDIMKWAVRHKRRLPSTRVPFINRKKLYNGLSKKIHGDAAADMKPKEVFTTLPSGRRCGITVFNIYSQITSLLGNRDINQWSNYFFQPTSENPFNINLFSDWDTSYFNDIETSIWYERTRRSVLKSEDDEILVPICLFIDGTVLSLSGSLSLEPVMMSIMIHNRETRKKPDAWVPLGYIHDPTSIPGKKFVKPEEKYSDYHSMLTIVLSDLMKLVHSSNDGLMWTFKRVPGHKGPVQKKLIFRLAFVIGDTKGHDILCGRMGSHNKTPGLCRDCDMLTMFADDPTISCTFIKQSDLTIKTLQELKAMSFYRVPFLTFDRLSFGASPYGINGATAIDIIHGLLIGMMNYLHITFIDHLTKNQLDELSKTVAFIATFCSRRIPGFLHCHHFRKGLSVKGIMTAKMKLARCFLVLLALKSDTFKTFILNQSGKLPSAVQKRKRVSRMVENNDDDLSVAPSSTNSDDNETNSGLLGFCSRSSSPIENFVTSEETADHDKEPGDSNDDVSNENSEHSTTEESHDNGGINDDVTFSDMDDNYNSGDDSTYDPNKDIESKDPIVFTEETIVGWTELLDNMLSLYGWLTSDSMPCHLFKYGSRSIAKHCTQRFMQVYKDVAYRFEDMGLKLTKFHQLRHWYFYVSMYGVPTNFDSSFCETHHIEHTKKTGRRTQKRQDELASQTAQRVYEANLLHSAQRKCRKRRQRKKKKRKNSALRGASFTIDFDYLSIDQNIDIHQNLETLYQQCPVVTFSWTGSRNKKKKGYSDMILQSLSQKLAWFNNGTGTRRLTSIHGYTEIRLFRATHEKKRNIIRAHPDYRGKGYWLDWIGVRWEIANGIDTVITLPAQVIMILDFDTASYGEIPNEMLSLFPTINMRDTIHSPIHREGVQLLLHSAANNEEHDTEVFSSIGTRHVMEPVFQLVHIENVDDIIFVGRDPPSRDRHEMDFGILHVKDPAQWGNIFIERNSVGYECPGVHDNVEDEFNENHHPWEL